MWMRALAVLIVAASLVSAQTKSKTKPAPKATPKSARKAATPPAPPAPAARTVPPPRAVPPPKDESARDKTLASFLARFKEVLKRRDRNELLALAADDVDTGVRDMIGHGAFFTAWALGDKDSSVYSVLTQILSMPGVWVDDQYCGPYVSIQFPSDLDRGKHQVVLNPNVRVRATDSASARTVATVSYEIVEVLERGNEWTRIRTQSGIEGYIQIAYLYSPAGYRACFAKDAQGAWKLQSLALPR